MDYKDLLQIARVFLSCPVCRSRFSKEDIKLHNVFGDKVVIRAHCRNSHPPVNIVFVANLQRKNGGKKPIEADDVLDISLALEDFNGDFEALFNAKK